ncbi:MAG: GNAT family protein [Candidatus Micrarchaeia archaeon]|jgi:RimJ/RimL family protein N-acetyltransferase
MKPEGKVAEGKDVYLVYLKPGMVSEAYVGWLNDKEINKYLEVRFDVPHTLEKVRDYVEKMHGDADNHLFAIMLRQGGRHIGNIKVGPVNAHHKFAEVGIMIGDRGVWGKGYGSEAITLATDYAFKKLGIHKLVAGLYDNNVASLKAFENAGYAREGLLKKKFLCDGKYVDHVLVGKLNE